MKIGVFISDDRMKIVAEILQNHFEVFEMDENESQRHLKKLAPLLDAVLLPAWSVEPDGFIQMQSRGLYIAEFLESLSDECILFAGKDSSFLHHLSLQKRFWLKDETLLLRNAELTAEGLLARIITVSEKSLDEITIDVIGSGRCASAVIELLNNLNCHYRMITRNPERFDTSSDLVELSQWKKDDPSEIIVNTAPVCVMDCSTVSNWKDIKHVFDISTGFVGMDEKCRNHPFVRLYKENALPSRFSKRSAALLIVNYVRKELMI